MANIADITPKNISSIVNLSRQLGDIDKDGARALSNLGDGLKSFAFLDTKGLKKNIQNVAQIEGIVDVLVKSFSGKTLLFSRKAKSFGEPLKIISEGLKSFSEVKIKKVSENLKNIEKIKDIIPSLTKVFTEKSLEGFSNLDEKFGAPLVSISQALTAFSSEINFSQLVKNSVLLRAFGPDLHKGFVSLQKMADDIDLEMIGKNFGEPMNSISEGLQKFGELSLGKILKNAILLRLLGPDIRKGFLSLHRMSKEISLRKIANDFAKPLIEMSEALNKFASIKWGRVLLSAALFKMFHKILFLKKGVKITGGKEEENKGGGLLSGLFSTIGKTSEKVVEGASQGFFSKITESLIGFFKTGITKIGQWLSPLLMGLPALLSTSMTGIASAGVGTIMASIGLALATAFASFKIGSYIEKYLGISDKASKMFDRESTYNSISKSSRDKALSDVSSLGPNADIEGLRIQAVEKAKKFLSISSSGGNVDGKDYTAFEAKAKAEYWSQRASQLSKKGNSLSSRGNNSGVAMSAISTDTANAKSGAASNVVISGGSTTGVQTNNVTNIVQTKSLDRTDMVAYGFRGGRHR